MQSRARDDTRTRCARVTGRARLLPARACASTGQQLGQQEVTGMSSAGRIVAIEEHFWIPALRDRYTGARGAGAHTPTQQLDDLGERRLRDMDAAGIDVQVISHMQPGTQIFDPETAVAMARRANDALYEATRAYPKRFAGFAELPTPDPKAAADELERSEEHTSELQSLRH